MTGHIIVEALDSAPATLSPKVLGILRQEWGFDGLIISDSMTMGAISNRRDVADASVQALKAGVDMLLFGADPGHDPSEWLGVYQRLRAAVRSGEVSQARLDEAVKRILRTKYQYGIMKNPYPLRHQRGKLNSPEHQRLANIIAEEALTMVNGRPSFLAPDRDVIILWPVEGKSSGRQLTGLSDRRELITLPQKVAPSSATTILNQLDGQTPVVVASYSGYNNTAWLRLIREISEKAGAGNVLVLSLRSPVEMLALPVNIPILCVYDDGPASIRAIDRYLRGELAAKGSLPVSWRN